VWKTTHSKPISFYDRFERKGGDIETTHYCPGCGHGVLHKLIAEAIDDFGIQDRTILVGPVGCAVFMYYYLDVGNISSSHGRAPAVATGVKRMRPESVVICYQGDGDLAAIGGNEILHAANRGEPFTVFFINNGIYGMTGGQMAPTTPLGQKTTTSPKGRTFQVDGPPIRMCELLATLDGPAYVERVALTDTKQHMRARKAVRRGLQNQMEGRGFSFIEVLTACPTNWHLSPQEAIHWVEKNMIPIFPLKVFKDRSGQADRISTRAEAKPVSSRSEKSASTTQAAPTLGALARGELNQVAMKISGFGGQGVVRLGQIIGEAGVKQGLHVAMLKSHGTEMRGGYVRSQVVLSKDLIDSPMCESPDYFIALSSAAYKRFKDTVTDSGIIIYDPAFVDQIDEGLGCTQKAIPAKEPWATLTSNWG